MTSGPPPILSVAVALALAACVQSTAAAAEPAAGDEASHVFPSAFDDARKAALDALRSVAIEVVAQTAHLEGVLPRAGAAPEARIDVWLRTDGSLQTTVLVRIARPAPQPIVPPGQVSGDGFLGMVAQRLGLEPPHRTGGAAQVVAPPAAEPGGDGRGGYGWALGPLGPPAWRFVAGAGFERAFVSAAFQDPVTNAIAYAHLSEGVRAQAGAAVPNDPGGRLDTRLTVGVQAETGSRELTWLSVPVELVETLNAGPVRAGLGVVQHLGARAVGHAGWAAVPFRASPGAVARLGVVVPTGNALRGVSSALVVSADASWVRLSAQGRTFDATSGGISLDWMF